MNTFFSKLRSDRSTSNDIGREKILFRDHNFLFVFHCLIRRKLFLELQSGPISVSPLLSSLTVRQPEDVNLESRLFTNKKFSLIRTHSPGQGSKEIHSHCSSSLPL